jgi:DNA-binding CsgD family transcriptional regulator
VLPGQLWERDQTLQTAAAHIDAARAGRGGTVLVQGDGGIGKTSVLHEVVRHVGADITVASARCDPLEAALPFELLLQLVHALEGADNPVWPPAAEQSGADARAATFSRSLQWLRAAASGPLLLTVDDLQWADPDSLACLGFLCRRLTTLPVVVLATLRSSPVAAAELAQGLADRGDATIERLAPLSEQAAAGVLAQRHGALPEGLARRAWRTSGGNPLLLGLAAGALVAQGTASAADGIAVPLDQRSLVLRRFADLSEGQTGWAQAASILGVRFRPDLVHEVAGVGAAEGEAAAAGLWRNGLVRTAADGTAEFAHPIFAQLLHDDLAPLHRIRLHRLAFLSYRARGMADLAAEHAVRADLVGDAGAVEVVTAAGRRAFRAGASQTAVERLEAAVHLSGDAPADLLLADLGRSLVGAGRPAEAVTTISRMLQSDLDPRVRVEALTTLSVAHFSTGALDRGAAALQSATALAAHACPDAAVLPLCHYAGGVQMTAGPAAALLIADRALALAEDTGPRLRAQTGAMHAMLAFWCGDSSGLAALEEAGRHLLAGTETEIAEDLRSLPSGVLSPYAGTAALAGRFGEAETAFRTGIEAADRVGAVNAGAAFRIGYGVMLLGTHVPGSLVVAEELLAVADLVPFAEPFARCIRSHALLERGAEEDSLAEQERAEATVSAFGLWLCQLRFQHVQGLRLLRGGRFAQASTVFALVEERERQLGVGEPCLVPVARHAVIAHLRSGRVDQAERLLQRLDEQAAGLPCRWPRAALAASRAALALHHDDHRQADALYGAAVELLEGASLPLELAEVLIDHGTLLRRDGRAAQARDLLRRAAGTAEAAGAIWLARRAGEELSAAGGRRRASRAADALTSQEQRVAKLASTGASTRDIATHLGVSVRTVRTHLEHIYRKLGIHSRRDLMLAR